MDKLITSQRALYGRISRTWENVKKAGSAKINLELIRTSMGLLDDKWKQFESQHEVLLRDYAEALQKTEYWKEDLVELAEVVYMQQRSHLLSEERRLSQSEPEAATGKSESGAQSSQFPRIDLPIFSGRFEDWPAFRDLFRSMVVEETALSKVKKLHYLKTSVTGEADNLLKNLPATASNFERAWATLEEHYDNKRLLVRSYLTAFTSLSKMRAHSMQDLRDIFYGASNVVKALEGIGRPIFRNEDLFVHLVVNLLDQDMRREWDRTLRKSSDPPSFEDLRAFMKEQLTSEEALHPERELPGTKQSATKQVTSKAAAAPRSARTVRTAQAQTSKRDPEGSCPLCKGAHFVINCEQFVKKTPQGRKEVATQHSRCFNCFGRHQVNACNSTKGCRVCSGRHHTTLHDAFAPATHNAAEIASSSTVLVVTEVDTAEASVLLATARVWVRDTLGREHSVRALLDSGSEASLLAESLAQRLRLPRTPTSVSIYGINGKHSGVARGRVTITMASCNKLCGLTVSALVLPRLTAFHEAPTSCDKWWSHLDGLSLADPEFMEPDPVEIILGAKVYAAVLMPGLRRGEDQEPIAQQTRLGWVLLGGLGPDGDVAVVTSLRCSCDDDLSTAVSRFWEWEEPKPVTLPLTKEEKECEEHFVRTHARLPNGRFRVRLPFRTPLPDLAETKIIASRMLTAIQRRFARDTGFRDRYIEFMREYAALNHMTPAAQTSPPTGVFCCYLPHHGVLKSSESGPKIRVVFNGSARTTSGATLNAALLTGPNLVPSLQDIVLRWRCRRFAFVADIEKMYRQIEVHPHDRDAQRILWEQDGKVMPFQLNTVTYGTACAPYLAIRVLHQLAHEEGERHPAGAAALQCDTYVDDVLSGASTLEESRRLQQDLIALCMAGGFPLKKWAANHSGLLSHIPPAQQQDASAPTNLPVSEQSVLGLRWRPSDDCLTVVVNVSLETTTTKRTVLSQLARLFDPLGWLAPVVVQAKLIIQNAWLQQREWDEPLTTKDAAAWQRIVEEIPVLEAVRIPRWFGGCNEVSRVEIHGFADASERAFAAVVYLRTSTEDRVCVSLVQANKGHFGSVPLRF